MALPPRIVQAPSRTIVTGVGAALCVGAAVSFFGSLLTAMPKLGGGDATPTLASIAASSASIAPRLSTPVANAEDPTEAQAEADKIAEAEAAVVSARRAEAEAKARADRLAREAAARPAPPPEPAPAPPPTILEPVAPPAVEEPAPAPGEVPF